MPQDANHLIWIDMEMTGLNPDADRIIEVGTGDARTDGNLDVVGQGRHSGGVPGRCGPGRHGFVERGTPGESGLIDKVKASALTDGNVQEAALAFLCEHVPSKASPMCGQLPSVQDRRFLARWMPDLENWFHYRNLDVSTLKELCRRWNRDLMKAHPEGRQARGARRRV